MHFKATHPNIAYMQKLYRLREHFDPLINHTVESEKQNGLDRNPAEYNM